MSTVVRRKNKSAEPANGSDRKDQPYHKGSAGKILKIAEAIWKMICLFFLILSDCVQAVITNLLPYGIARCKNIAGQNVLITGAASGLGRLLALRFAGRGCTLVLWDRDESGLAETAAMCAKAGCTVKTHRVDMTSREDIANAAAAVRKELGFVHIVVNNAGVGIGGKVIEVPDAAIKTTMDVNAICHFWMAKEFLPAMWERDEGHVVTVASLAAIIVSAQEMIPYCTSKFAALAIQEGLENETACQGKSGVRFTTICPAYFQTKLMTDLTTETGMDVMTPEYVADRAVEGILREMRIVFIPKSFYLMYALKGVLPRKSFCRLMVTVFRNSR